MLNVPLNVADLKYRELLQAFIDFGVGGTAAVEAPEPFHVADKSDDRADANGDHPRAPQAEDQSIRQPPLIRQ